MNVAALLTFAADKNSFVEDCGSTALRGLEPPHRVPCGGESQCEESASITPLDKIHEAVMITAEEQTLGRCRIEKEKEHQGEGYRR